MGRNLGDMMAGILGDIQTQKDSVDVTPASKASDLEERLKGARAAGDTDTAAAVLKEIQKRRSALSETGITAATPKKRSTVDITKSVTPSMSEIMKMIQPGAPKAEKSTELQGVTATREQMRDITGEVNGWGAEPSSPGQWGKKKVAETDEAKQMEASPEGPANSDPELASSLMDKLEAHHSYLTNLLKGLPEQLRAHAQHSPYFGPAHSLFADQLDTRGEASFDKPDRLSLREKRDMIENSIPSGSKHLLRKRAAVLAQNFAAMTYRTPVEGVSGLSQPDDAARSYIQDVPGTGREGRKAEALSEINKQISAADFAAKDAPAHIRALTVDLPVRLAQLKSKMNDIRQGGSFLSDNSAVNHKAIMDIADSLSTINNSINSNIATGTKAAINQTFAGTGLILQNKFKNFLGTSLHSKIFEHIKWQGKNLSQKQPSETWRNHVEPHPDWVVGADPNNLTRILKGLATKKGLTQDQVMSKPGHIWGLHGKDAFGRRTTSQPREQIQITPENAKALQNSKDADQSGVAARDLGNRMRNIINDYNAGNTARYNMYTLPPEWQPTGGKGGSGTRRIVGSGDVKEQRAQQDLYPLTEEAVTAQEEREKPIVAVNAETGEETRARAGTGGVYVKPVKKKAARSQRAMGSEIALGKVSREAAINSVKTMTNLAKVVERAKKAGTTYDKDGNTKPISEADSKILQSSPDALNEVFTHVKTHQDLIQKHAETIRTQGKEAIPQEDRISLGFSGLREAHRRAAL
jgi:hypothetical protein